MLEDYLVPRIWVNQHYYKHIDWKVGSPIVKNVVEDLEEYLENVDYLKSSTTSSLKRCRWNQIIDILNNRQISPSCNCSTLAIPWCFYKISRAFDGISTSIIWQKYHPPELKHRPIFLLLSVFDKKLYSQHRLAFLTRNRLIVDCAPTTMTWGKGFNSRFSTMVRLGTVIQTVFSFVRSFSHFLFLRHRIICWPGPLPKG